MNCQIPGVASHRTCKQVLLAMGSELVERSKAFDIFFCSPPIFSQRRGEAQSRGESKIRDELSF
jgi:hypothetical protein